MITLKDIAADCGLSVSAISRVLNESGFGSEKTRLKVLKSIEKLGYTPNSVARGMIRGKMQQIALVIPDICNPFYTSIARGVEDVCNRHDYRLLLCNTDECIEKQNNYLDRIRGRLCDGFIISVASEEDDGLKRVDYSETPYVMVSRKCPFVEADYVGIDDHYGSYMAVSHLIRLGHTRIAAICGKQDTIPGKQRLQGYKDAMSDNHYEIADSYICLADFMAESAYLAAKQLICLDSPPTAIFVGNNQMTLGCLRALKEENILIPKQIALVAYYGPEWADVCDPPLTCIDVSAYEMGRVSAELLFERLSAASFPSKHILLTPELTIRKSCGS